MSKRFYIADNGIWDNGKKLSWQELCDVLNELACNCKNDNDLLIENRELKQEIEERKAVMSHLLTVLKTWGG